MKSRHYAREVALQVLYRYDVSQPAPSGHALAEDLNRHFDHFKVDAGVRQFAAQLIAGTLTHAADLDQKLDQAGSSWKISRMALIDRNLLRMALYEMLNFNDIPYSVTIDEAVELAKQFCTAETSGFINGILDALRKAAPAKAAQ